MGFTSSHYKLASEYSGNPGKLGLNPYKISNGLYPVLLEVAILKENAT